MKRLVVFTGAGISQESGLQTFRDSDGLWEKYNIEDVATIDAWHRNPGLVLDFYNQRRASALKAIPNEAHKVIASLESKFDVQVITQNIDNLHERAGSTNVLHLHGMIDIAKSSQTGKQKILNGQPIQLGDLCEDGHQMRPDIVWFGEDVPNMETAAEIVKTADVLLIVGTSLNVYPAAGLIHIVEDKIPKYLVDPSLHKVNNIKNLEIINEKATIGVPVAAKLLIDIF